MPPALGITSSQGASHLEKALPANKLLITADSGGSNGYQIRLWKKERVQYKKVKTGKNAST
ncbi:MAG: hypothetical protein JRD04_11945 [Deltaproteobacteria bacterium]|nr:hypothetical protein [Deltaproteobacteria bacterium]